MLFSPKKLSPKFGQDFMGRLSSAVQIYWIYRQWHSLWQTTYHPLKNYKRLFCHSVERVSYRYRLGSQFITCILIRARYGAQAYIHLSQTCKRIKQLLLPTSTDDISEVGESNSHQPVFKNFIDARVAACLVDIQRASSIHSYSYYWIPILRCKHIAAAGRIRRLDSRNT